MSAGAAPSAVRFKVLAWLCSLSALTYVDRIGIMQVREDIQRDLAPPRPPGPAWALKHAAPA